MPLILHFLQRTLHPPSPTPFMWDSFNYPNVKPPPLYNGGSAPAFKSI